MTLREYTVLVDAEDLAAVEELAAREGRSVSELVREALHLAIARHRCWEERGIPDR